MKKELTTIEMFRKIARDKVGNYESEIFDVNVYHELDDLKIQSPIEQVLYVALKAACKIIGKKDCDVIIIQNIDYAIGVAITPQVTIGKYRVDFLVSDNNRGNDNKQESKEVIVECDSQEFHDRTEPERRYEKCRDRYLQKQGYKVFRFTGSEILKQPFDVSAEILEYVTGQNKEEILSEISNF